MNKGKSLTFYGLFDIVDSIQIPILQRDYAQGRTEEGEVRTLFLNSLFDALNVDDCDTRQPLDLDFVYGNFEEGDQKAFSVLDGQQRLTTLFLLHWYLAVDNKRLDDFRERFVTGVTGKSCSRFTYKTRPSTTEFFNALTARDITLSKVNISAQICNSQWFYLSWQQDPTVQACLNMLDAIQERFTTKSAEFYKKLINTADPFITFQFLDLHSFGLSDELYIKMNARGKPLTIFENFKAKLEQKIKSFEAPWPPYYLTFIDGDVGGYEYFIHKIDTDWADLFWPYRNVCSDDNTFDDELMNFFRLIISYQYLEDNQESAVNLYAAGTDIFGRNGRLQPLTLLRYEKLNCLNKSLIIRLINTLDLIYNNGLNDNKIQPYLLDDYYYSEDKTFNKVLENSASYDDKLRFYAFYTYLARSPESNELEEWIRVIYNLTENTIINTADEFYKALFAIDKLCQIETPILVTLASGIDISGFTGAQVLEEKIKAHLLLKSDDWRDLIILSEKHSFLDGQIGCILNFSGILDFYREHNHCGWSEEQDKQYIEQYSKYTNSITLVFDLIERSSSSIDFLWERAVLSKGAYFTDKRGDKYNMLSSRDTRNNIPRDHSWRRLLRIGSSEIEQKQSYVKALFDDALFDAANLKESLTTICTQAVVNEDIETWKKTLIKHKELMAYCQQGFIEKSGTEFILLGQSQRNHNHIELYSKVLELELVKEKGLISPFDRLRYNEVKSRDDHAYAYVEGWILDGSRYSIEIRKYPNKFNLRFVGGEIDSYSTPLLELLENHGFEYKKSIFESLEIKGYFHENNLKEINDVSSKVLGFCSSLRDINK